MLQEQFVQEAKKKDRYITGLFFNNSFSASKSFIFASARCNFSVSDNSLFNVLPDLPFLVSFNSPNFLYCLLHIYAAFSTLFFPIISILKREFPKTEITIKNDAKCAALAEKNYGSMKKYDDCIFLCLGTGIGRSCIYKWKNAKI